MKPISNTKRLALGLGIIVLGFGAALPFRHTTAPEAVAVQPSDDSLTIGEGVALQVPGQTATSELPARALRPWVGDDENGRPDRSVPSAEPETPPLAPPPALPDNYRPLFRPLPSTGFVTEGAVRGASDAPAVIAAPKQHTIHDGDTLESLALRYLGDSGRAGEILEANRDVLSDPAVLPIGVKITIPSSETPSVPDHSASAALREPPPKLVPLPTEGYRRGL